MYIYEKQKKYKWRRLLLQVFSFTIIHTPYYHILSLYISFFTTLTLTPQFITAPLHFLLEFLNSIHAIIKKLVKFSSLMYKLCVFTVYSFLHLMGSWNWAVYLFKLLIFYGDLWILICGVLDFLVKIRF